MKTWGNTDILNLQKTAFLCSQKCPADVVLKSYDWTKGQWGASAPVRELNQLNAFAICGT